jgi:hypothetical protein
MTRTQTFSLSVLGAGLILGCSGADPAGDEAAAGTATGGALPVMTSGGMSAKPIGNGGAVATGGMGVGPSSGGASAGGAGSQSNVGNGGSGSTPSDVQCYEIKARAAGAAAKYSVPTTPDLYQCFDYVPPWGNKKVQVVSSRPLIDNTQVIHHWILYNTASTVTDGTNGSCSHPGATFITGWAPGGQDMVLPPDVGLVVDGAGFTLEVHYNNKVGEGQLDESGVELCVTENLRPKEAAVHWLGTANLNKLVATGTCTPTNTMPVTILASSPHMYLQGEHMKTVINRKGGGTEILIDQPFDFNTQVSYPTPATINPGDTLTTTCTYKQPTPFGEGTNEEMCFNFVTAYPAGQLVNALSLQKNDCTSF